MRGSRNFRQGGPGQSDKKSSDNVFYGPQLILQKSNGQFQRNLSFFKVPEGVQHFPRGGGPTFSSGVPLLIPYRKPYDPMSPKLDPHLCTTYTKPDASSSM